MTDLWGSNADDARVQRQDDQAAETRDAAGELGTIEPYWDAYQFGADTHTITAVLPDYAPDMHGYIRLTRIFSWVAIILGSATIGFLAGLLIGGIQ